MENEKKRLKFNIVTNGKMKTCKYLEISNSKQTKVWAFKISYTCTW